MTDKRSERILEELVKLPGNNYCADCHSPSPRWASVNLGITLCVSCASIHRKLGTHKSRVKSITLDTWSREHIASLRSIGNTASNQIYNPDEKKYPPPTSSSIDERDSEMEKYIRKKYELGAFKAGASGSAAAAGGGVTSRDRFRTAHGLESTTSGSSSRSRGEDPWKENKRNPELNTLVVKKERELPPLPLSAARVVGSSTGGSGSGSGLAGRERPKPSVSPSPDPSAWARPAQPPLVDLSSNSTSSTGTSMLPLQSNTQTSYGHGQPGVPSFSYGNDVGTSNTSTPMYIPNQQQQQSFPSQPQQGMFMPMNPNPYLQQTSTTPIQSPPSFLPQQQFPNNPFNQQQQQGQGYANSDTLSPYSMNNGGGYMSTSPGLNPGNPFFQSQQQQQQGMYTQTQGQYMATSPTPGWGGVGQQQSQQPQYMPQMQMQGQGQAQGQMWNGNGSGNSQQMAGMRYG